METFPVQFFPFKKNSARLKRTRSIVAITVPFFALALQRFLWPIIQPFSWILFYLAISLSSRIGNFFEGIAATCLSIVLVWYFFIPFQSFHTIESKYFISTAIFFFAGLLFSSFNAYVRLIENQKEKAEFALETRSSQMRAAEKAGNFGSWTWDIKKGELQWSSEVCNVYGIKSQPNQNGYESFLVNVHPDDQVFVRKTFTDALVLGKSFCIEYRIDKEGIGECLLQLISDVYADDGDSPSEMIGIVYDVTEEKKMEQVVRESEEKFRGLLETAYDPIVIIDSNGLIEFANQQFQRWFGYDPKEIIGQPVEMLIPERFRSPHVHQRQQYQQHPLARPMGRNLSLFARRKDGTEFPIDISLSPSKTSRGEVVTAFMRDMTEQKQVENQQRFLSDTSKALSETMDYQERIQRIVELVVPQFADCCAVYIHENHETKMKASAQIAPLKPEVLEMARKNLNLEEIIKLGEPELIRQFSLQTIPITDQAHPPLCSALWVPMFAHGRTIGIISFGRCEPRQLTEQDLAFATLIAERAGLAVDNARLYQEAQQAIRSRQDILAVVSHDLRNPLGVIGGFNEIIAERAQESNSQQDILNATNTVNRAVQQMNRLIADLLDFAKIESGTLSIELLPTPLPILIHDAIELVRHHADKKHILFKIEIEPQLKQIVCDPERISQVISNILGNAIKFSPEKTCIFIRVIETPTGAVEFAVTDQGAGISEDALPHIFDRYWQAKATCRSGVGLGLAISKGIVESHHGQISVKSKVGVGTTFYFTLPSGQVKQDHQSVAMGPTR